MTRNTSSSSSGGGRGGGGSRAAVARWASADSADVKRVRLFCGGTGDVGDVGEGGAFCIVSGSALVAVGSSRRVNLS